MADSLSLGVKSSSVPGGYTVTLRRTNNGLLALNCDCKAGQNGLVCKHRIAVAAGDQTILLDLQTDHDTWAECQHLLGQSKFPEITSDLAAKEQAADALKREIAKTKKNLGRLFQQGA